MSDQPIGYMLQGFYFQSGQRMGIEFAPIVGAVAVIREGITRRMFAGLFGLEDGKWSGTMIDAAGTSSMVKIELAANYFTFTKKYEHRRDVILYELTRRENGLWAGSYSGDAVGTGKATCILTPIPEQMFQPPQ